MVLVNDETGGVMTVMAKTTRTKVLRDESEESIAQELGVLLNEPAPNVDAILRKTGRFNRLRGRRVKLAILSALKNKGQKDVNALLDRHS
jgi:hypothetical protein